MASNNVNCGQENSKVWEVMATFPSRSVGINLLVNCFAFLSQILRLIFLFQKLEVGTSLLVVNGVSLCFLVNLSSWVWEKNNMVPNEGTLYKSFLQMCFKNAFLRKSLVPKVLFVISIITVAISGLHIQKENSYLKITATYWTENCQLKQPGTTTMFWFLPAFTCQIAPVLIR